MPDTQTSADPSPRTVLLVVHQRLSDPGRVGLRLRTLGYNVEICRHACGEPLPTDMSRYAGVTVFGGPMSANDDHEDFIRNEIAWIPSVVESGVPFLGICLGAQLLSRAAGGAVAEHPEGRVEIGYYPVRATDAGKAFFPDEMRIFQWHREGFTTPETATLLATGDCFPEQAFAMNGNALAIQFHPEVTEQMNRRWLIGGAARLVCPGAQQPHEHHAARRNHDPFVDGWVDGFLQRWLDLDRRKGGAVGSSASATRESEQAT
ncbi:MAG: gamma-glutamyl-gamma-aminobutyrate hydrolase family protein [Minwuia sp.]|nr:gamma-glutamyl-gamma-aminobutyrate hydrolase family protein [Minwuia sp.]